MVNEIIKPFSYSRKLLLFISSLILLSLTVTACSLPPWERYQYINSVKDQLDYESLGTVVEEGYDDGDGVFSPSYFEVKISGDRTVFDLLKYQLLDVKNIECNDAGTNTMRCKVGQVRTDLVYQDYKSSFYTVLRITDSSSGRDSGRVTNEN